MSITDTVLLGTLGAGALAAGGLGAALFFTLQVLLQGVLSSLSILIGEARGKGHESRIAPLYWNGFALALLLAAPAFALLSYATPLLLACGEPAGLARDVGAYTHILRWGAPACLIGGGLMRAFLSAVDGARTLLWVSVGVIAINAFANYGLIHGAWGLPRLGLLGSATATALTLWLGAAVLLAAVHIKPAWRDWVRPSPVRLALLRELLRLGGPIGVTYGIEITLFLVTGLLAGQFGPAALAAHQIALNVASTTFTVPLAVSQAANVRVSYWRGAGAPRHARHTGFVSIALGAAFMLAAGCFLIGAPRDIVGLYLDLGRPDNAETVGLSVALLTIAALFQAVDGIQTVASGCLRGLADTRVPMLFAATGYWAIGLSSGYALAFRCGLGVRGLWYGMAAGLAACAILMTWRFARLTRAATRGTDLARVRWHGDGGESRPEL